MEVQLTKSFEVEAFEGGKKIGGTQPFEGATSKYACVVVYGEHDGEELDVWTSTPRESLARLIAVKYANETLQSGWTDIVVGPDTFGFFTF